MSRGKPSSRSWYVRPPWRVRVRSRPPPTAVTVEEMEFREGRPEDNPLLDVHVNLFVERESQ